jgi:heat shock protein HtpX
MAAVLAGLGYVIGAAFGAGVMGFGIAAAVWAFLAIISLSAGDQILLATSRAAPVTRDVHPQLFNVVEEMTIAAGLPKMPKIYIINERAPNAFATGRSPQTASVAVTAGLLTRLNRDELQGVVAHEISHILHRDILFVTLAGIMLGSIVLVSNVFLRGMFYSSMSSSRRRTSVGGGGGQAQLVFMVVALVCAILAPLFAYLLYFALSRRREYLADAGAARLTRYPEGLAGALEKIAGTPIPLQSANKVTAPMYIVNPLKLTGRGLSDLTSTHPPISERIRILRSMSGASLADYQSSYAKLVRAAKPVIPASAMRDAEPVPLRPGEAPSKPQAATRQQFRQADDIMRLVNGFIFLSCGCGLKMKIPPNFAGATLRCPRCGRTAKVR